MAMVIIITKVFLKFKHYMATFADQDTFKVQTYVLQRFLFRVIRYGYLHGRF